MEIDTLKNLNKIMDIVHQMMDIIDL